MREKHNYALSVLMVQFPSVITSCQPGEHPLTALVVQVCWQNISDFICLRMTLIHPYF